MANNISNDSHLFVILVLVAAVVSILLAVAEGDTCSEALGACGPAGDCDQRCKALHIGGQGSCDLNLCTCYYNCIPSPSPPERKCYGGLGLCTFQCNDDCCNSKCASKFNQGVGYCNNDTGTSLCTCQYACFSHLLK